MASRPIYVIRSTSYCAVREKGHIPLVNDLESRFSDSQPGTNPSFIVFRNCHRTTARSCEIKIINLGLESWAAVDMGLEIESLEESGKRKPEAWWQGGGGGGGRSARPALCWPRSGRRYPLQGAKRRQPRQQCA